MSDIPQLLTLSLILALLPASAVAGQSTPVAPPSFRESLAQHKLAYTTVLGLSAADGLLTQAGLATGHVREANPFLPQSRVGNGVLFTGYHVAALWFTVWLDQHGHPRLATWERRLAIVAEGVAVVNNAHLLWRIDHEAGR